MSKMFLLTYYFLDQKHLTLVEIKNKKKITSYHVTILTESFFDVLNKKLVLTADSLVIPRSGEVRNTIDAIKIALHNETQAGQYN